VSELKIQLVNSTIGRSKRQRKVVAGLGLRRIGQAKILEDTPAIRGMVTKVAHLVTCEAVTAPKKATAPKTKE
jgi:large subunit ribosomal protein L30